MSTDDLGGFAKLCTELFPLSFLRFRTNKNWSKEEATRRVSLSRYDRIFVLSLEPLQIILQNICILMDFDKLW